MGRFEGGSEAGRPFFSSSTAVVEDDDEEEEEVDDEEEDEGIGAVGACSSSSSFSSEEVFFLADRVFPLACFGLPAASTVFDTHQVAAAGSAAGMTLLLPAALDGAGSLSEVAGAGATAAAAARTATRGASGSIIFAGDTTARYLREYLPDCLAHISPVTNSTLPKSTVSSPGPSSP